MFCGTRIHYNIQYIYIGRYIYYNIYYIKIAYYDNIKQCEYYMTE